MLEGGREGGGMKGGCKARQGLSVCMWICRYNG